MCPQPARLTVRSMASDALNNVTRQSIANNLVITCVGQASHCTRHRDADQMLMLHAHGVSSMHVKCSFFLLHCRLKGRRPSWSFPGACQESCCAQMWRPEGWTSLGYQSSSSLTPLGSPQSTACTASLPALCHSAVCLSLLLLLLLLCVSFTSCMPCPMGTFMESVSQSCLVRIRSQLCMVPGSNHLSSGRGILHVGATPRPVGAGDAISSWHTCAIAITKQLPCDMQHKLCHRTVLLTSVVAICSARSAELPWLYCCAVVTQPPVWCPVSLRRSHLCIRMLMHEHWFLTLAVKPVLWCRYVHRVGRTARMGQQGQAMLFLLPSEKGYIHKLQQHGVKVQQGNLMQHILLLQELGTAPVQVCHLHLSYLPLTGLTWLCL